MVFSGIPFLYFFLPIVILLYLLAPKKLKNTVLLVASMFFYAWGERWLVFLFAASIFLGWGIGLLTYQNSRVFIKRALLLVAIVYDLGLLAYFKYSDFFVDNINNAFGTNILLLNVALPIGISFYTFQLLSYNIDVYRGRISAQKNLINFAAYVSMFPQLIAGPIVRYGDIEKDLVSRKINIDLIYQGIIRFVIGLSKKVLIANVLGELIDYFHQSSDLSVMYYWMYAICFGLQIYYDFSGYSDMAIGLGNIFGFRFPENFNYPFISKSITEFWRRWHITLGSWFRDYVYIPLGGNRKGIGRQLINIFIVWALTGLWHGASWNFVLWGLMYGVLLTIEKLGFSKVLERIGGLSHVYTLFFVIMGFVVFEANGIGGMINDIRGLFSFKSLPIVSAESIYYLRSYAVVIILGIMGATPIIKIGINKAKNINGLNKAVDILSPFVIGGLLIIVTAYLVDGSFNPFLYFRF